MPFEASILRNFAETATHSEFVDVYVKKNYGDPSAETSWDQTASRPSEKMRAWNALVQRLKGSYHGPEHGASAVQAWPGDLAALLDAQEDLTRVPFSSTGQDTGPATKKPRLEQPSYHANIPAAAALSNATSRLPTGPQATSP